MIRRILSIMILSIVLLCHTGYIFAANGDLIVNGNLGVGTASPESKAEINGNMKVDGNMTVQGNLVTSSTSTLGGNTAITGNLVTTGTTTIGGNATITGNLITNGTTTLNGNLGINGTVKTSNTDQKINVTGGIKVTGSSFYVATMSSCPSGDTLVSSRTAVNTCSMTFTYYDSDNLVSETGSCTTGSHGWGTSTSVETCSYNCARSSNGTYTSCTCNAIQMKLCNPGQ